MFLQIRCSIKNLFPYHAKAMQKILLVQIYPVFVNCLFAYSFFYWLIDWFLYLSFLYTRFYRSPNTNWKTSKKRTENNTWIMAKTDMQSTHAFQIDRSDHKRENRLVLSPLSWCTTCGGLGLSLREQQFPLAPLHPLAEIQGGASLVMRKREEGGIITWPLLLHTGKSRICDIAWFCGWASKFRPLNAA